MSFINQFDISHIEEKLMKKDPATHEEITKNLHRKSMDLSD